MENSTASNVMESSSYSQVIFDDNRQSYPSNTPIVCRYLLTAGLQPSPRDWVGIFKVGWSSAKDYHTFVWVEPSLDAIGQDSVRKQVLFREYYLPKDETEFYQFCYVDINGIVKGVSSPFCFQTPNHMREDYSLDDECLVITTQIKVEEHERKTEELQKELERTRKQNEILTAELEKARQEMEHLKVPGKDFSQQVFEQQLQLQEKDATEKEDVSQSMTLNESQKRQKVSQLKRERDELRKEDEAKSAKIAQLNRKVKESEQELLRTKDHIQLQQVDLQSSERENKRLCRELDKLRGQVEALKEENQKLCRTQSERKPVVETPDGDLNVKYQNLQLKLQETSTQLLQQLQATENASRWARNLEKDLDDTIQVLEERSMAVAQEKQRCNKLEMQLSELYINLQDQASMGAITKKENEELTSNNLKLKSDIEKLQRQFADLQAAPPAVTTSLQHSNTYTSSPDLTHSVKPDEKGSDSPHYEIHDESIGSATEPEVELSSLQCRYCQERFPGITQEELTQHEQSHRVCPFCTFICDSMEQAVFEDHVYSHEL